MKELTTKNKPIAIALGYFDCVHFAHRHIISEVISYAHTNKLKSAVFTFSNELTSKGSLPIYLFKERKKLFSDLEVDYVVPYHFDDVFKNMVATEFLELLFNSYDIRCVCCGADYRFGSGGTGDPALLRKFAAERGAECRVFEPIEIDGEVVSTSLIKAELLKGNIEKANRLLCSPYFIEGKVTNGKGRGHGLGFPTANLKPGDRFVPGFGVYKSRTVIDADIYPSITNIGNKPTFDDDCVTIETFIDGNVFNLYAKNIRVELLGFIRGLIKFSSAAKLKEQIKKDLESIQLV